MTFYPRRIEKRRREKGMKAKELAEKMGCSRQYLHRLEAGEVSMTLRKFEELLTILEAEPNYFFKQ